MSYKCDAQRVKQLKSDLAGTAMEMLLNHRVSGEIHYDNVLKTASLPLVKEAIDNTVARMYELHVRYSGVTPLASYKEIGNTLLPALKLFTHAGVIPLAFGALAATSANSMDEAMSFLSLGHLAVTAARWVSCGCPSIRLTPIQACALALTDITQEQLNSVRSPWPSFVMYVGDAFDHGGVEVDFIFVDNTMYTDKDWFINANLSDGTSLSSLGDNLTRIVRGNPYLPELGCLSLMTTPQEVAQTLICKTAANLCEVLHSRNCGLLPETVRKKGGKKRRVVGKGKVYCVNLSVKIDLRKYTKSFIADGGGTPRKVRWLTRGHHRNQACGTGRLDRKRIWIEPYWNNLSAPPGEAKEHRVSDELVGL